MRLERREPAPDRSFSAAMFAPKISRQTWRGCVITGRSGRPSGQRATGSNAAVAVVDGLTTDDRFRAWTCRPNDVALPSEWRGVVSRSGPLQRLCGRKQIADVHAERVRDAFDVVERGIAFAAFDRPDVRAVQFHFCRERLLRNALVGAKRAHVSGDTIAC